MRFPVNIYLSLLLCMSSVPVMVAPAFPQNRPVSTGKLSEPGDYTREIDVDQKRRQYIIHIPKAYEPDKSLPLVFVFHGGGGIAAGAVRLTKMNNVSERHGFIAVYPESIGRHWNDGFVKNAATNADDVGFISNLIDELVKELNIDKRRVYATGISNGGFFSERLALELSDKVAAVAMVAATKRTIQESMGPPKRPVPVMFILGTDDPIVPFAGGTIGGEILGDRGQALSASAAIDYWLKINNCPATPKSAWLPESNPPDGTKIKQIVWGPGKQDSEVVAYEVWGGGHCWPSGIQYLPVRFIGKTSKALDASEVIWQFFTRHQL